MSIDINIPGLKVVGPYLNELQSTVANLLGVRHNRFPGAQPVSFTRNHIQDLIHRNFFVCEKTDGLRLLLFATYNRLDRKYETFLINRANEFYFSKLLLPIPPETGVKPYTKFHHNTIIDGELVIDTEPDGSQIIRFLVFDCLVCREKVLISRPFHTRLGHFHDFVLKPLTRMATERPDLMTRIPFTIEAKIMQLSYHVRQIFLEMKSLKHKSDGLIFTSSEDPYTLGTDQNILKWKPAEENTVDFLLVVNRTGSFELHLWHGGHRHEFYAPLIVDDPHTRSVLIGSNGRIIECHYEPQDVHHPWRFMRFRSDKNTANHISVFERIMKSISDGIDRPTLEELSQVIRTNWKQREHGKLLSTSSTAPMIHSDTSSSLSLLEPSIQGQSLSSIPRQFSPDPPTEYPTTTIDTSIDHHSRHNRTSKTKSTEFIYDWDRPNAGDPIPRMDDWYVPEPDETELLIHCNNDIDLDYQIEKEKEEKEIIGINNTNSSILSSSSSHITNNEIPINNNNNNNNNIQYDSPYSTMYPTYRPGTSTWQTNKDPLSALGVELDYDDNDNDNDDHNNNSLLSFIKRKSVTSISNEQPQSP